MESLICDHLVNHMMKNKLFCHAQLEFIPGRSCMIQLLVVIELCTICWILLTQFMPSISISAKRLIPHLRLLTKLKAYGIAGDTYDWIIASLTRRSNQVVVNSSRSSWLEVLSGIPRSILLGLILFVLFINDLPDMVQSTEYIIADDTKVYRKVFTDQDCIELEEDIGRVV